VNDNSRFFAPTATDRWTGGSIPIPVEDRREHARFALRLAITLRGENNFYTGLSENISEAGIFIATQHVLPIGTPVVLSFTLPTFPEPISVGGRVQWVRGPDATAAFGDNFGDTFADVKAGIGIQFSDLDQATIEAIRGFMQVRRPDFFA
jgi:uncharacterized protein (TIGR02266 family)